MFVALQALGPFCALLLSSPEKVQRLDGTKVVIASGLGFVDEVKAVVKLWASPRVLLLTVVFFQAQWAPAATGTYLASYFSVRARALSSLVTAFAAQGTFYLLGYYLDLKKFSLRARATYSGLFIFAWLTAGWIWLFINQVRTVLFSYRSFRTDALSITFTLRSTLRRHHRSHRLTGLMPDGVALGSHG